MTRDNSDPQTDPRLSSLRPSERPSPPAGERRGTGTVDAEKLKSSKAAQFEYGRRSQHSTEHFDRTSRRLEQGNPDIGDVDLGTIEADRPPDPDDNDHFD